VQGVKLHSHNVLFGENPGKICGHLGKLYGNLRKIAVCALIYKNGTQNESADVFFCFFWSSSLTLVLFGQVRGNLGKNGA